MNGINQYIRELLACGNDVFLPGIGTFFSTYQSAAVHPIQHIFQPPSLRVSFSGEKKGSENLIQFISSSEKISRHEAEEKINRLSGEIINYLYNKKVYEMDEVGKLILDPEKKIIFIQNTENILDNSFGLPSFTLKMIDRKANGEINLKEKPKKKFKFRFGIFFFSLLFLLIVFEFLAMAIPLNNFNLLRETRASTQIYLLIHPQTFSIRQTNGISNWIRMSEPTFWHIERTDTSQRR
jgi:hypothetical protein